MYLLEFKIHSNKFLGPLSTITELDPPPSPSPYFSPTNLSSQLYKRSPNTPRTFFFHKFRLTVPSTGLGDIYTLTTINYTRSDFQFVLTYFKPEI